jgi:hypothetical protein
MEPYNLEDILHDIRELKRKLTSVLPTIKKVKIYMIRKLLGSLIL